MKLNSSTTMAVNALAISTSSVQQKKAPMLLIISTKRLQAITHAMPCPIPAPTPFYKINSIPLIAQERRYGIEPPTTF